MEDTWSFFNPRTDGALGELRTRRGGGGSHPPSYICENMRHSENSKLALGTLVKRCNIYRGHFEVWSKVRSPEVIRGQNGETIYFMEMCR